MSTTTIRIEDDLKARVAAAAQQMGKSAHAFIVDALAERVEQVEQEAAFHALADERWARIRTTGRTVGWTDAKDYLLARANVQDNDAGRPRKPAARKLAK
jgi:predicted transcriptional regulator